METISSSCCTFSVNLLAPVVGYCFSCSTAHEHQHLDLQALKHVISAKRAGRYEVNWQQLSKDPEKFDLAKNGKYCFSIIWRLLAHCPHGAALFYRGSALAIHICAGGSYCLDDGRDFTFDVCQGEPAGSRQIGDTPESYELLEAHLNATAQRAPNRYELRHQDLVALIT
jgi:hypothetical protein